MTLAKKYSKILTLLLLSLLIGLIYYSIYYSGSRKLEVSFLDVGQGDAIFIKAPNGRQMLIDGGINAQVLRELGRVMPFYDRSIDVVLATHPDADHIGGLNYVLDRFTVDLFVRNAATSSSAVFMELVKLIEEKNIKQEIVIAPEEIYLDENTVFRIFYPDEDIAGMETNDASIVGRLIYGENSFFLTGDSPISIEKHLVSIYGDNLKSDVLKAGHHGSKTSSAEIFVETVAPEYTIISAGLKNRYGHPHQEVITVLEKFGAIILRTMDSGTITFISNGKGLKLKH